MTKGVTTFQYYPENGGYRVTSERDGKVIKERFALNREHAQLVRRLLVEEFWGFRLN